MTYRIAVAGKGGTGKSTIAAFIILQLCENQMGPILAIDADPDANLGTLLGVDVKKTIGHLREDALREVKNFPAGMSKANYVEAGLHQIIEENPCFDLITMGRGEGPGCYCYLNSIIKKFSDDLMPGYPWVVIDNEAGLEHISRRTSSDLDALIVVINDNPISFRTAKSIIEIAKEIKNNIKKIYLVTNSINESRKDVIEKYISSLDAEYVCDIPNDSSIQETLFNGDSLKDLKESPVKDKIKLLIKKIGG